MPFCLGFLMVALPVLSYFFAKWIERNNRFGAKEDIRNRESAMLLKALVGLNGVLFVGLGCLIFLGLSQTGVNIATAIFQIATFAIKLLLMNFVFVWVRWTLPRFRYDQLQHLGWRILMPLAIANIFITATIVVVFGV